MVISSKRVCISLLLILALSISPIFISDFNTVNAATQDDLAKVANAQKGKRAKDLGLSGGWCSKFVWQSAKKAGLMNGKTFPKKSLGGTDDIQSYYTKKDQYRKATKKFKPEKGDLAIFGSSKHVGIVTKVKGKYVTVTHGNWSNKVCITKIKKYGYDKKAHAQIKGYVRLDYEASEPKVTIKFNAKGGKVSKKSKKIRNTKKIGKLPSPAKKNAEFLGWYTKAKGGKKITKKYKVDIDKSMTLYAHYAPIPEKAPITEQPVDEPEKVAEEN